MRRLLALAIAVAFAIPDVPFIEREPQLLGRSFVTAHQVANRKRFGDLAIHGEVQCDKFFAATAGFFRSVSEIAMQREAVHIFVTLFEHFAVPFRSEERRVGKECRSRWLAY